MIDSALVITPVVQVILPPVLAKTSISKILKDRGNWITLDMITPRVLRDMPIRAPSMNLLINHYRHREFEIPTDFKRQIVMLGHQPILIKNRPCIIIEYKPEGTT